MPVQKDVDPRQRGAVSEVLSPAARLARAEEEASSALDPLSRKPWRSPSYILGRAGVPRLGTDIVRAQNGVSIRRDFYPTVVEGLGALTYRLTSLGEVRQGLSGQPELVISTTVYSGNTGILPSEKK